MGCVYIYINVVVYIQNVKENTRSGEKNHIVHALPIAGGHLTFLGISLIAPNAFKGFELVVLGGWASPVKRHKAPQFAAIQQKKEPRQG